LIAAECFLIAADTDEEQEDGKKFIFVILKKLIVKAEKRALYSRN
jgi:hypothetical protein